MNNLNYLRNHLHVDSVQASEVVLSFLLIVILVLSLMYGYIGWRIIIPAAFSLPVNIILWGLLIICVMLPFLPVIMRINGFETSWIDAAAWIGYLSFGFLTVLFAFLLAKDVILLLVTGVSRLYNLFSSSSDPSQPIAEIVNPARRKFLTNYLNVGVLGVTGTLIGYGMYQALRKPDLVEVDVPIKNLPDDLDGFRIAQITDIHVSHTIKRGFVQRIVDIVNDLRPDMIVLTGDLADGSVERLRHDVAPLADLKAPHGSFFITGNHEYYSGVRQWLDEVPRLGFNVLLNEHRIIAKGNGLLLLAGVTDIEGGRHSREHISDPHKALAGASEHQVKILLAHQPKSIFEAAKAGYDYVISGHTHGGQYFPYHFLAALTQPYVSGLHKHGDTHIYVSRGTGYWGPQIRIGARSEITLHKLTKA